MKDGRKDLENPNLFSNFTHININFQNSNLNYP